MAKQPETSRKGKRIRSKNPDHPVARFCAEAVRLSGGNAAALAEKIGRSRGLMTQYAQGETRPSMESLIDMSIQSGLSLGYLSVLAAEHAGKPVPKMGEIEGRLALVPLFLREGVYEALAYAERIATQMPGTAKAQVGARQTADHR